MKQSSYVQNAGHPTRQLVKTPKINVKKIKTDRKTLLHLKKKKKLVRDSALGKFSYKTEKLES